MSTDPGAAYLMVSRDVWDELIDIWSTDLMHTEDKVSTKTSSVKAERPHLEMEIVLHIEYAGYDGGCSKADHKTCIERVTT